MCVPALVTRTALARLSRLAILTLAVGAMGCGQPQSGSVPATATPAALTGTVTVGGSSTMFPISRRLADAFEKQHPGVHVTLDGAGTGAGFQAFCAGQRDIADASRPINAAELGDCAANRIEFIELPVAFDSLSVVVNSANTFATCLTLAELRTIWEPAAEKRITRWNQIRSTFPDRPITLVGPDAESGTFDYFTLAIVGAERASRTDYIKSDDDQVLANTVASDANALGYFGFSYATSSKALRAIGIDAGAGCIAPSPATVTDHTYQPLSRPMFVYVNAASATRPEVNAFARSYVAPENARIVSDVGDTPLPIATLLTVARRLDTRATGTRFGGRGAVIGITPDTLRDEDRIKNALVR